MPTATTSLDAYLSASTHDDVAFKFPRLSVTARRGNAFGLGTSLPKLTLAAHASALAVNAELPALEVTANGLNGILGEADISLPKLDVTARAYHVIGGECELPALTVTAKCAHKVDIELPVIEVTATGKVSVVGLLSASIPALTVYGKTGFVAEIELPLIEVTGHGLNGSIGEAVCKLPSLDVTSTCDDPLLGRASVTLPRLTVYGQGSKNVRGTASISIPMLQVSPRGYAGILGRASITLPCFEVDGTGYINARGTASISLPILEVEGNTASVTIVINSVGETETITGYALVTNLENAAISEYSNYGFNSFAKFNGVYLGASSTGIYKLSGDKDNTSRIVSKFRTSLTDGDTSLLKGVEDVFIGLSSDGVLEATIISDGNRSYLGRAIPARETDEIVTQRVKLGKGIKSRYYSVEIQNRAGADFDVESIELPLIPLRRQL